MAQHKWIPRPYREGDEEGIFELFKAVYPERKFEHDSWMRWWHWMYQENPAGRGIIWLAEDDGKIVGHDANIPVLMKMGDGLATAGYGVDSMTHPNYRRQGIWNALNDNKEVDLKKAHICMDYSFPRRLSRRIGIRNFGSMNIAPAQTLVKPFKWRNTLRYKLKNEFAITLASVIGYSIQRVIWRPASPPRVEGLKVTKVSQFDDRIDRFWNKASNQYQILPVRQKDYLNCRYVTIPDIDYSIYIAEKDNVVCGYTVLRTLVWGNVRIGVIFDLLSESVNVSRHLLWSALEQLNRENVDVVYCRLIANKTYFKAYRKSGFIRIPFVHDRLLLAPADPNLSRDFLKEPTHWYSQLGDSDFF